MHLSLKHFFRLVPFFSASWHWTKHDNKLCGGSKIGNKRKSHETEKSCAEYCEDTEDCHGFMLYHYNGVCQLYYTCLPLLKYNFGDGYSKQDDVATKKSGETILPTGEITAGPRGTTLPSEKTTKGSVGITLPAEEIADGDQRTTLAADKTTKRSGKPTMAAEKTTGESEGTTQADDDDNDDKDDGGSKETTLAAEETSKGPEGTTLAPEGTTEGPGSTLPAVEGTTEVPEPDKTITKINKPATEVLIKSTLEHERTTLGTKENTESQETPSDYENTVHPISPQVTKIPRIVTTSAFTEGNSGDKTRRWPKDVPLIKQINR